MQNCFAQKTAYSDVLNIAIPQGTQTMALKEPLVNDSSLIALKVANDINYQKTLSEMPVKKDIIADSPAAQLVTKVLTSSTPLPPPLKKIEEKAQAGNPQAIKDAEMIINNSVLKKVGLLALLVLVLFFINK